MRIGFIVWNPFMVYHMRAIAQHLDDPVFLILDRQSKVDVRSLFGRNPADFIGFDFQVLTPKELAQLDGSLAAVVCPNPFPGIEHLRTTACIGMQYSMAKDRYVNGPWRAMFDFTLTYGKYSAERISPFCPTAKVGNPRFHRWFNGDPSVLSAAANCNVDKNKPTLLYLPTWGEFSSVDTFLPVVVSLADEYNVLLKVHHKTHSHEITRRATITSHRNIQCFGAMDDLLPLLASADLVMSDYSGAIFDAIYVRKPILLLQSDPAAVTGNKFGLESIEYARREEIGPVVSSPAQLRPTLAALTSWRVEFQRSNERLRSEIFEHDTDTGAVAAEAIVKHLKHPVPRPLHQIYLRDELKLARLKNQEAKANIRDLKTTIATLKRQIKQNEPEYSQAMKSDEPRPVSPAMSLYMEGMTCERNRQWNAAATKYRTALSYDSTRAEWHARLGYVLEQQALWDEAASAFEAALQQISRAKPGRQ